VIKVRPNVILLDLRDAGVAADVLSRPIENVLVEYACEQLDGGDEVDDGAVAIHAVVVLDEVETFAGHHQHYDSMVANSLGTRFLILLGGVQGSISDDHAMLLHVPPTLNRDTVRLLWVPYPTASVWAPGDSRARGIGVNTSEVSDDFGLMTVRDVVTVPEVFEKLFSATEHYQFGPLSVGTRQAYFGQMSREALADACREAGEVLAGNRLQDPLAKPPTPWRVPGAIGGECAEFDPIKQDGGFGKFLLESDAEMAQAAKALGIGPRRGWFGRCIADPSTHIAAVRSLGDRYEDCTDRALDLFDTVDPTDGFDVDEFEKLADEGIHLYPGRDIVADPVKYTSEALELLLEDLHLGHSVASLSATLRHQIRPIAPRPRSDARDDLDSVVDRDLIERLRNCGSSYPDNIARQFVRRTLNVTNSQIGRWAVAGVIGLLVLLFLLNELIVENASSNWIIRMLGWNPIPGMVITALVLLVAVMVVVGLLAYVVDRQLKHWAIGAGVTEMFTALRVLIARLRRIAVNDWTLYRIRTETAECFDTMLNILQVTSERILGVMTGPSENMTGPSTSAVGVNPEIRIDFNESRDVGMYRNFGEVVRILRGDALALIEQAFGLYFDQLRGGDAMRSQVVDRIGSDLDLSLTALVDLTMDEGIILRTPRKLPGGRRIITDGGLQERERLVRDIWADEGVIRDTVAEAVLAASSEAMMHFVHPRDLVVVDFSGDNQVDIRFAPVVSGPPLAQVSNLDSVFHEIVFTEQSSLAGVLRLVPFRLGTYEFLPI